MQVRGQLADFLTKSVAILLARSLAAVPTVRITNLRSSRKAFIWLIPGTKKAALPSPGDIFKRLVADSEVEAAPIADVQADIIQKFWNFTFVHGRVEPSTCPSLQGYSSSIVFPPTCGVGAHGPKL